MMARSVQMSYECQNVMAAGQAQSLIRERSPVQYFVTPWEPLFRLPVGFGGERGLIWQLKPWVSRLPVGTRPFWYLKTRYWSGLISANTYALAATMSLKQTARPRPFRFSNTVWK